MDEESYDWFAAEGRPSRLRPLRDVVERMCGEDEAKLAEAGIVINHAGIDWKRERVHAEVCTRDLDRAKARLEELYGVPIDLALSKTQWSPYRPLVRHRVRANDRDLMVEWYTLGGEYRAPVVEEDDDVVTVTVVEDVSHLEPGVAIATVGVPRRAEIHLDRPLGRRTVVDGVTGQPAPYGQ